MLHILIEDNKILYILVELTASENLYPDSSPLLYTIKADIINNKWPNLINSLEISSPHFYCQIKREAVSLFVIL